MRSIFGFFSMFDVITPAVGLIQDFWNDPTLLQTNSWTFFIDHQATINMGLSAGNVEDILRRNGIKTWGGQSNFLAGEYFFCVSKGDASRAEQILAKINVPVCERSKGAPAPDTKTNMWQI